MTQPGLARISPELVELLGSSTERRRREIVEAGCVVAMRKSGIDDRAASDALAAVEDRAAPTPELRIHVDTLVQRYDEMAWDLEEQIAIGQSSQEEQLAAFAKARAVAALGFALDDSIASAFDSLYEAYHAVGNDEAFLRAVVPQD